MEKIVIHWFRRDLRLTDNTALSAAANSGYSVLPIFIFDTKILDELERNDARVNFIHKTLSDINLTLKEYNSSVRVMFGEPLKIWQKIVEEWPVAEVFFNKDYEPYALERDQLISTFLNAKGIKINTFKDHVIFEEDEIMKPDSTPYTVFTPYKKRWMERFQSGNYIQDFKVNFNAFLTKEFVIPSLDEIGFMPSQIEVIPYNLTHLDRYSDIRNLPADDATSYLSPHIRFGTISIRQIIRQLKPSHQPFLDELIWREFFVQILFHFPRVVGNSFKTKYDNIQWRNNEEEFQRWCEGRTGYPMVDAGMRQLNETGYMHNRVRMVVASFLCKHLLIDWRWGEAYFAKQLLDYDLAANNGNWQWSAGTGCDAAPYFRVFNPAEQQRRFDPQMKYVRKWVPEVEELTYPQPIVEHKMARDRALKVYKVGLERE